MFGNRGLRSHNAGALAPLGCAFSNHAPSAEGIYEVATVPGFDELPYVFEMERDQMLTFSLVATAGITLTLCSESAYDSWVDGGFESQHPEGFLLHMRKSDWHSLEFRAPERSCYVVVLINLEPDAAEVAVAAVSA